MQHVLNHRPTPLLCKLFACNGLPGAYLCYFSGAGAQAAGEPQHREPQKEKRGGEVKVRSAPGKGRTGTGEGRGPRQSSLNPGGSDERSRTEARSPPKAPPVALPSLQGSGRQPPAPASPRPPRLRLDSLPVRRMRLQLPPGETGGVSEARARAVPPPGPRARRKTPARSGSHGRHGPGQRTDLSDADQSAAAPAGSTGSTGSAAADGVPKVSLADEEEMASLRSSATLRKRSALSAGMATRVNRITA